MEGLHIRLAPYWERSFETQTNDVKPNPENTVSGLPWCWCGSKWTALRLHPRNTVCFSPFEAVLPYITESISASGFLHLFTVV